MAQLPNADQAIIDDRKITHYLPSRAHPDGAGKAQFFEGFGFSLADVASFRSALLDHAMTNPVSHSFATPFGTMYEVIGPLMTPDGRNPSVLVVWMMRTGESEPRLVTAVPS